MSSPTYRLTPMRKVVNFVMMLTIRIGIAPLHMVLMRVRGSKSGKVVTRPVTLVEGRGKRYAVSPYGEVAWVKTARAGGEITLSRFLWTQTFTAQEVPPAERAAILRTYVWQEPVTLAFFKAGLFSPLEAFAAEADRHPVFLLVEQG
jgi:hypothetical protein